MTDQYLRVVGICGHKTGENKMTQGELHRHEFRRRLKMKVLETLIPNGLKEL